MQRIARLEIMHVAGKYRTTHPCILARTRCSKPYRILIIPRPRAALQRQHQQRFIFLTLIPNIETLSSLEISYNDHSFFSTMIYDRTLGRASSIQTSNRHTTLCAPNPHLRLFLELVRKIRGGRSWHNLERPSLPRFLNILKQGVV